MKLSMLRRVQDQKFVARRLAEGFPFDWIDAHGRVHSPQDQCYACINRNDCTTQEIEKVRKTKWTETSQVCAKRVTGESTISLEGYPLQKGTVILASDVWSYPLCFSYRWNVFITTKETKLDQIEKACQRTIEDVRNGIGKNGRYDLSLETESR